MAKFLITPYARLAKPAIIIENNDNHFDIGGNEQMAAQLVAAMDDYDVDEENRLAALIHGSTAIMRSHKLGNTDNPDDRKILEQHKKDWMNEDG
tara:strand:+ start:6120 stop:6401 length:282 start_codon:yes stop_codon:yes gene_type:complete